VKEKRIVYKQHVLPVCSVSIMLEGEQTQEKCDGEVAGGPMEPLLPPLMVGEFVQVKFSSGQRNVFYLAKVEISRLHFILKVILHSFVHRAFFLFTDN